MLLEDLLEMPRSGNHSCCCCVVDDVDNFIVLVSHKNFVSSMLHGFVAK